MCNYYVDLHQVANYFARSIYDIKKVIQYSESNFSDFISDGLIDINDDVITVHKKGRLFTRNISMRFDPLINKKVGTYSNTI